MSEKYYPLSDIQTYEDLPDQYKQQFSPFGEGFVRREAYENYMDAQSSLVVLWWTIFHKRSIAIIDGVRTKHYENSLNPHLLTSEKY